MTTAEFDSDLIPNDGEFDRMKAHLFELIDQEQVETPAPHFDRPGGKRRRPGRRALWIGASALTAGALTVALVAGNVFGPHAATADAAEVLHDAALATIHNSDPVVGAGQYLEVETKETAIHFAKSPTGQWGAYEQPQLTSVFIPADPEGAWVIGQQWLPAGASYGDAQANIDDFWAKPDRGDLRLYQADGGKVSGDSYNHLDDITRLAGTGDQLLPYLYDHAEGSNSRDEAVFVRITDLLKTGQVPAALRGRMYDALARVPGVYLAEDAANLDGRTGVAISFKDPGRPNNEEIIIDPSTGLLIGIRALLTEANGPVPAGASEDWTSVTTSVVDEAPAGPYSVIPPAG